MTEQEARREGMLAGLIMAQMIVHEVSDQTRAPVTMARILDEINTALWAVSGEAPPVETEH